MKNYLLVLSFLLVGFAQTSGAAIEIASDTVSYENLYHTENAGSLSSNDEISRAIDELGSHAKKKHQHIHVEAESFDSMKRWAEQGDSNAQYNLGVMYAEGTGVRQDYAKAREWYQKAAGQGFANAQYLLGAMYFEGKGVRQNTSTAKEYFGKSCDNGNQDGCDTYRLLN